MTRLQVYSNMSSSCVFVWLQVVLNKAISKTQKVRFFTPAVLACIASLYKWNGIVDASANDDTVSSLLLVSMSSVAKLQFFSSLHFLFIVLRCQGTKRILEYL